MAALSTAPLGIDIAKATFDVALLTADGKIKPKRFDNSQTGFSRLERWLKQQFVTDPATLRACMEATARYGQALARYLHERGYCVSVVNPAATRAFSRCEMSRTKTDKADAALIARFCRAHRPRPWTPPSEEVAILQALVKRLESRCVDGRERCRLPGGCSTGPKTAEARAQQRAVAGEYNKN